MAEVVVNRSQRPATVDDRFVRMLPPRISRSTYEPYCPVCVFNGKAHTLIRVIALLAGHDPSLYFTPENGDHFDCRVENIRPVEPGGRVGEMATPPAVKSVKGIVARDGSYQVILKVNGVPRWFATAGTLALAKKQLRAARKTLRAEKLK